MWWGTSLELKNFFSNTQGIERVTSMSCDLFLSQVWRVWQIKNLSVHKFLSKKILHNFLILNSRQTFEKKTRMDGFCSLFLTDSTHYSSWNYILRRNWDELRHKIAVVSHHSVSFISLGLTHRTSCLSLSQPLFDVEALRDALENDCEETKVEPTQETKSPITNLITDIFLKSGESVIIANIYNLVGL